MRTITLVLTLFLTASAEARIALFRAAGFPTVDSPAIENEVLDRALQSLPVDRVDDLRLKDYDLLILPYGSAFPLDAWTEIRDFVKRGGSLVVLGGAPFQQPVRKTSDGRWELATRQPTFAHEFLIGPAEAVKVADDWRFAASGWALARPRTVWELTVRLATKPNMPGEHGSEGNREGVLRPIVHLVDSDGIPRACPLLEIDRTSGARWIFAPSDAPLSAELIRAIVLRALEGAYFLDARPVHASVEAREVAKIRVESSMASDAQLTVRDDAGRLILLRNMKLPATAEIESQKPGLYHVEIATPRGVTTTGFWVRDAALLARGPRFTVSRDWLRRDGKVFPVIGTTYMASDVHRQFLFEPNPHLWDRDFAQMARFGINFVRTGLWTAWSRFDDASLRALDAYVQTAAKHGIAVNFTFYAFLPPAHGGTNPYLDPRSLDGQKKFLTSIASRYRGVGWIHYDLINEPSYAPPEGLWSNRPMRDPVEKKAWLDWIYRRHGDDVAVLRERWQDRSDDVFDLPRDDELYYTQIRENRRPRKVRDFVEFSNLAVASWAKQLRDALRTAGGDVLVTLGQDEGGTWLRPSQQLHAESIDYTCVHPWWQNDDVLSTGVFVKVPEKPSLFQEVGLMRLENVDGIPWRSPELAAAVLERKFAYAFAARSAGVVEWAWNINPYMPIDNESVIGFFRPDGTAKPELGIVPELAAFFRAAAPWLDDFEPDPVVIVIPHSRMFMGRPAAIDGFRRTIRVLAERLGVVPTALSDLRLSAERLRGAKVIIVPSVEFLSEDAASALLAASQNGSKILVTGAVTGDPYGQIPEALQKLGIVDAGRPVRFREEGATFDRGLQESLLASTLPRSAWHEPLPLEHAREDEPLVALLTRALTAAGVETHPSNSGVAARLLYAPRAVLAVLVNDTTADAERRINVAGRPVDVRVPAEKSRFMLFERSSGKVVVETKGAKR